MKKSFIYFASIITFTALAMNPNKEEIQDSVAVSSIAFNRQGTLFATGTHEGGVSVWSYTGKEILGNNFGHIDRVGALAFLDVSHRIASGSDDMTIIIWNIHSMDSLSEIPVGGKVSALVTNAGQSILYGAVGNCIKSWSIGQKIVPLISIDPSLGKIEKLLISPDDGMLACLSDKKIFSVFHPKTEFSAVFPEERACTAYALHPKKKMAALVLKMNTVGLVNLIDNTLIAERFVDWRIRGLTFAKDGKRVVCGASCENMEDNDYFSLFLVLDTKKLDIINTTKHFEGTIAELITHPNNEELLYFLKEHNSIYIIRKNSLEKRKVSEEEIESSRKK